MESDQSPICMQFILYARRAIKKKYLFVLKKCSKCEKNSFSSIIISVFMDSKTHDNIWTRGHRKFVWMPICLYFQKEQLILFWLTIIWLITFGWKMRKKNHYLWRNWNLLFLQILFFDWILIKQIEFLSPRKIIIYL